MPLWKAVEKYRHIWDPLLVPDEGTHMCIHTHSHLHLCTDITNNRTEFIAHVLREYKLLDLKDSFIHQIQCKLKLSLMLWNHSHRNWVMSTNLSQVEAKAGKLHYQRLGISLSTDWSNTLLVLLRLEWKR